MKTRLGPKFWLESAVAAVTFFLAVLTVVRRDWLEGAFGVDLDHHTGSLEWGLVIFCSLITLSFAALARRAWRRACLESAA